MNSIKKQEIKQKAEKISHSSEQFQLIHATYACQMFIKQIVIDDYNKKRDELRERIESKMIKGISYEKDTAEKDRLDALIRQRSFHIDVAYIECSEDSARVVKMDNAFIIYISKSLLKNIFDSNGQYNYQVISKIRNLMSHELGHLVLHTNELLQIDSMQGSKLIQDADKEEEADYFGQELLRLRKLRNQKIYQDGGAHMKY